MSVTDQGRPFFTFFHNQVGIFRLLNFNSNISSWVSWFYFVYFLSCTGWAVRILHRAVLWLSKVALYFCFYLWLMTNWNVVRALSFKSNMAHQATLVLFCSLPELKWLGLLYFLEWWLACNFGQQAGVAKPFEFEERYRLNKAALVFLSSRVGMAKSFEFLMMSVTDQGMRFFTPFCQLIGMVKPFKFY